MLSTLYETSPRLVHDSTKSRRPSYDILRPLYRFRRITYARQPTHEIRAIHPSRAREGAPGLRPAALPRMVGAQRGGNLRGRQAHHRHAHLRGGGHAARRQRPIQLFHPAGENRLHPHSRRPVLRLYAARPAKISSKRFACAALTCAFPIVYARPCCAHFGLPNS